MFQEPAFLARVDSMSAAEVDDSLEGHFTDCRNQHWSRWEEPGLVHTAGGFLAKRKSPRTHRNVIKKLAMMTAKMPSAVFAFSIAPPRLPREGRLGRSKSGATATRNPFRQHRTNLASRAAVNPSVYPDPRKWCAWRVSNP